MNIFTPKTGYTISTYSDGSPLPNEKLRVMAIDRQLDHYWCEIGVFLEGPIYRQLFFGRIETRDQLRQIQARYKVPSNVVVQDRGYRPSDVDLDSVDFGWRSMRGYGYRTWTMRDDHTGKMVNFPFSDPQVSDYRGGDSMFYNFSSAIMKDILSVALENRGDLKWQLPEDVNPIYLEHLKGESKVEVRAGVWEWKETRSNAANHGLDTSAMILCVGIIAGVLRYSPTPQNESK